MSASVQSQRPIKTRAVEGAFGRGKMVQDGNLNDGPDVIIPTSRFPLETSDTAVSLASHAVSTRRDANGQDTTPIDVDAIDDDVVFVSASTRINESSNQCEGTTTPTMVVLDEDSDAHQVSSGAATDPVNILSKKFKRHKRNLPGRDIINCDTYENLDGNSERHVSQKEVTRPGSKRKEVVAPKEPTFRCAVCLGHLIDETSTTCGHIFCKECIKTAIKSQKKCPTCRTPLSMRKIHRIYLSTCKL